MARMRRRKAEPEQLTPEHYLEKDEQFAKGEPVGKRHAKATILRKNRVENQWNK